MDGPCVETGAKDDDLAKAPPQLLVKPVVEVADSDFDHLLNWMKGGRKTAKALLRILQTHYSQNQYIVATHSPEVLSAGNPATIHVVRRHGYNSVVEKVNLRDINQLRDVADDLGISMTDVFAA